MTKINISVHELVDFVLRTGDIDDRVFNQATMQEGSRIHREYQSKQGKNYISEYRIKETIEFEDYLITIQGSIDGIEINKDEVVIEEIKSTNIDLEEFFEKNESWHLGQAEVYAYFYALQNDLEEIKIRLVYISQNSEKVLIKYYKYTRNLLKDLFFKYLGVYVDFLKINRNFIDIKNEAIEKLQFPFQYFRKGQAEIIEKVIETMDENKTTFIEARTGIGKTISFLYSSIKNMNNNNIDKIFYATAKNSGFDSVLKALNILFEEKLRLRCVQITAKEKICINKSANKLCNPDDCPFAKDYYSKINDVIIDSLNKNDLFDKERVLEIAKKNNICPFELSLDLSNYSDLILCDFNYVFDPCAKLIRYFGDTNIIASNKFLLVDEAHNLVTRSRDMYSAEISLKMVGSALDEAKKLKLTRFSKILKEIKERISEYEDDFVENESNHKYEVLDFELINLLMKFKDTYLRMKKKKMDDRLIDLSQVSLEINRFLKILEFFNFSNFVYSMERRKDKNILIKINCLDASEYILRTNTQFKSSLYFSGTLSPFKFYKDLILTSEMEIPFSHIDSPFKDEQIRVLVNDKISLKYKDRDLTINNVVSQINSFVSSKVGNYIVYCPSFEYLFKLMAIIDGKLLKDCDLFFQEKKMTNEEKERFTANFKKNPKKTTIGFCVLGGSFSEGIDLTEDRLIGVIIIGVGYPNISFETMELDRYYREVSNYPSFEYAFVNPGINKIMQAVGRLIRSENDHGMALLIDSRYKGRSYSFLFKKVWKNSRFINDEKDIEMEVKTFYNL